MRSSSMLSDPLTVKDVMVCPELAESGKVEVLDKDMNKKEIEDWEGELMECFQGPKSHVCAWYHASFQHGITFNFRLHAYPIFKH